MSLASGRAGARGQCGACGAAGGGTDEQFHDELLEPAAVGLSLASSVRVGVCVNDENSQHLQSIPSCYSPQFFVGLCKLGLLRHQIH